MTDRPRRHGRSKYGVGRVVSVLLDLLTVKFLQAFGTKPIRIFGLPGGLAFTVGVLLGLYLTGLKLIGGYAIGNRPLLILAVLLILFGAQLVMMGLIGELLIRIYHESQRKPIYSVKESIEGDPPQGE